MAFFGGRGLAWFDANLEAGSLVVSSSLLLVCFQQSGEMYSSPGTREVKDKANLANVLKVSNLVRQRKWFLHPKMVKLERWFDESSAYHIRADQSDLLPFLIGPPWWFMFPLFWFASTVTSWLELVWHQPRLNPRHDTRMNPQTNEHLSALQRDTICTRSPPSHFPLLPGTMAIVAVRTTDRPWPHLRVAADNKSSTFKWSKWWWINKVAAPKTEKKKQNPTTHHRRG